MGGELATLQTTICVLHAGMNALYCPNDGNSAILSLMRYIGRVTCAISAMMSQPTCAVNMPHMQVSCTRFTSFTASVTVCDYGCTGTEAQDAERERSPRQICPHGWTCICADSASSIRRPLAAAALPGSLGDDCVIYGENHA